MSAPTTFPVTVHEYPSAEPRQPTCAYELMPSSPKKSALIFIGGLGDGPHLVPYIRTVARRIDSQGWSVFEMRLASSFSGYGFGSLAQDVRDVSALVKYLRGLGKERIVLMGHSSGCQDCMEYTNYTRYSSAPVDGFILQAPVSDREAIVPHFDPEHLRRSLAHAEQLIAKGKPNEIMPMDMLPVFYRTPMTAYRWHSLAAPGGDDDYFSSDLPDDTVAAIWGRVCQPVLIVPSGADEFVPEMIDMLVLMRCWERFAKPGIVSNLSGLIPGANHRVDLESARMWLAERVSGFLEGLQSNQESRRCIWKGSVG